MDELRWVDRCWFGVGCRVEEPVEVAEDAALIGHGCCFFWDELGVGDLYYS